MIHSTWYGHTISVDVDMDDVAKDLAEYIDEEGPYPIHYCGCNAELILVKHKEPVPLDKVLKALDYQRDYVKAVRDLLAEYLMTSEHSKDILTKLSDIEGICTALENEWKDAYRKVVEE